MLSHIHQTSVFRITLEKLKHILYLWYYDIVGVAAEQETDFNDVDGTGRAQFQAGEATGTWPWSRVWNQLSPAQAKLSPGHLWDCTLSSGVHIVIQKNGKFILLGFSVVAALPHCARNCWQKKLVLSKEKNI